MKKRFSISPAKINILTSLLNHLIATGCGIILPRILIESYGSAAYGITVSIAQFLSYIALLESGIGGVARAQLYGPLAKRDQREISVIYQATKRFFRFVALAFVLYTLILALSYRTLAGITYYPFWYIFILVLVISSATIAKYMGGLANLTLMVADQKQYISMLIHIGATILNTVAVLVLCRLGTDLIWVKLGSSLVFILPPILYSFYVKRHYNLLPVKADSKVLTQRWTGLGQHFAFFLHKNTDIVLLTLLADIRLVAVYSVFSLVSNSIRAITESCSGGMEAVLGERIARKDNSGLLAVFRKYQLLLSAVTILLFGCAGILINDFVRLYTNGIQDANYRQPVFALLILFAEAFNCLCLPYAALPFSANHLKQTRWGAYGEAAINIVLSVGLIFWNPLVGVALATLLATLFRAIYYIHYAANHFLQKSFFRLLSEYFGTALLLALIIAAGQWVINGLFIENFLQWALSGAACFAVLLLPVCLVLFWYKRFCTDRR